MQMNLLRQMSKTSGKAQFPPNIFPSNGAVGRMGGRGDTDDVPLYEDIAEEERQQEELTNGFSKSSTETSRRESVAQAPPFRKISQRDSSLRWREHNLFTKKVPKDSEAANIQVSCLLTSPNLSSNYLTSPHPRWQPRLCSPPPWSPSFASARRSSLRTSVRSGSQQGS